MFAAPGATAEDGEAPQESDEQGAKRWRGRRRRRGGRGGSNVSAAPAESQEFIETHVNETAEPEPETASEIRASAAPSRGARTERAPEPFVFPGESLRKYGGTPAESAEKPAFEVPAQVRPASTYKPATLIESPIVWDGSGLLPGESLSRHRNRQPETPVAEEHSSSAFVPEADNGSADEIEEEEFVEETDLCSIRARS